MLPLFFVIFDAILARRKEAWSLPVNSAAIYAGMSAALSFVSFFLLAAFPEAAQTGGSGDILFYNNTLREGMMVWH